MRMQASGWVLCYHPFAPKFPSRLFPVHVVDNEVHITLVIEFPYYQNQNWHRLDALGARESDAQESIGVALYHLDCIECWQSGHTVHSQNFSMKVNRECLLDSWREGETYS